ncbi:MAG: S-layer homology domain-containing protein [Firmicutes bacterium]|nr:S-layer homology domain-containing protein [Bacillota bacterium]
MIKGKYAKWKGLLALTLAAAFWAGPAGALTALAEETAEESVILEVSEGEEAEAEEIFALEAEENSIFGEVYYLEEDPEAAETDSGNAAEEASGEEIPVEQKAPEITLSQRNLSIPKGKSARLYAEISDEKPNETIIWSSADSKTVSIDNDGTITALKEGMTVVYASLDGQNVTACNVTVTAENESAMELSASQLEMKAISKAFITLVYTPDESGEAVLWTSSNPSVISVDERGMVKANSAGKATIIGRRGESAVQCDLKVLFSDIREGKYYYGPVYWAVDKGFVSGKFPELFAPDDICTRAEAVTMLWRANGSPYPSKGSRFTDVSMRSYYYNPVCWACENNIISGTGEDTFSPHKTCTRAEIVTMLWRCRRQKPQPKELFKDVEHNYSYNAIIWAAENNIVSGMGNGKFKPDEPCTRGQIVTMLYNADAGGYYKLDKSVWQLNYPEAEAVLNEVGWDLRQAFNWSASLTYYGNGAADMPDEPSPGTEWFADFGFKNHKGNCYVKAATFYEMAASLGYAPRQITGEVPLRRGGMGPHSWIEIDIYGETFVYDPEKGYTGFKFKYGQPGTWRYTNYSPMQTGRLE